MKKQCIVCVIGILSLFFVFSSCSTEKIISQINSSQNEIEVKILSPAAGVKVSGDVEIVVSAAPGSGFELVGITGFVDTNEPENCLVFHKEGDFYLASWDSRGFSEGTHIIAVKALDDGGHEKTALVSVTVENGFINELPVVEFENLFSGMELEGIVAGPEPRLPRGT